MVSIGGGGPGWLAGSWEPAARGATSPEPSINSRKTRLTREGPRWVRMSAKSEAISPSASSSRTASTGTRRLRLSDRLHTIEAMRKTGPVISLMSRIRKGLTPNVCGQKSPGALNLQGYSFSRDSPRPAWPIGWWRGGGSNSRPSHCERDALPAELPPHGDREFSKGESARGGDRRAQCAALKSGIALPASTRYGSLVLSARPALGAATRRPRWP